MTKSRVLASLPLFHASNPDERSLQTSPDYHKAIERSLKGILSVQNPNSGIYCEDSPSRFEWINSSGKSPISKCLAPNLRNPSSLHIQDVRSREDLKEFPQSATPPQNVEEMNSEGFHTICRSSSKETISRFCIFKVGAYISSMGSDKVVPRTNST